MTNIYTSAYLMEPLELSLQKLLNSSSPLARYYSHSKHNAAICETYNTIALEHPELRELVVALSAYPILKWAVQARDIVHFTNAFQSIIQGNETMLAQTSAVTEMMDVQQILSANFSIDLRSLHLQKRECFFNVLQDYIITVNQSLHEAGNALRNKNGIKGNKFIPFVVALFSSDTDVSVYQVKKYLPDLIATVNEINGQNICGLFDELLKTDVQLETAEMSVLYHNVDVLLDEYNKMCLQSTAKNAAIKILSCKSEKDIVECACSDATLWQAGLLIEFSKLICSSIESTRTFPDGGEVYQTLRWMLDACQHHLTLQTCAKKYGVAEKTYRTRKRRAATVLGSLLWGYDATGLVNMLMD